MCPGRVGEGGGGEGGWSSKGHVRWAVRGCGGSSTAAASRQVRDDGGRGPREVTVDLGESGELRKGK